MWPFYKSVKSRNLSNVLSVLCHVGPTLSSLVARNALVMYGEHSFRIKNICNKTDYVAKFYYK